MAYSSDTPPSSTPTGNNPQGQIPAQRPRSVGRYRPYWFGSAFEELPSGTKNDRVEAYLIEYTGDPDPATGIVSVPVRVADVDPEEHRIQPPPGLTPQQELRAAPIAASNNRVPIPDGVLTVSVPTSGVAPSQGRVWKFLVAPASISFGGSDPQYSDVVTHATTVPDKDFSHTSPMTLTFKDIQLETWWAGKHCMPLLDGLLELTRAHVANGEYTPPRMSFIFGDRRFEPVVVKSPSWEEEKWLSGNPAGVKLSFTLERVPFGEPADSYTPPLETEGDAVNLELTDRQMEEGRDAAIAALPDHLAELPDPVAELVRSDDYSLVPASDGTIFLYDGDQAEVGSVGTWDGSVFTFNWQVSSG